SRPACIWSEEIEKLIWMRPYIGDLSCVHGVEHEEIQVSREAVIPNLNEGDENAGSDVDDEEIRADDLLN
ncbi:hypothetical protein PSHT_05700, partial [Puccinia striiformis]